MIAFDVPTYHPAAVDQNPQACKGRRTSPDHADRRYKPYVFAAFQCAGYAVQDANGLCSTCERRRSNGSDEWHGRVDEAPELMPITSHIPGGPWANRMVTEGKFLFFPNGRPQTAKQEGHLDRAPIVPAAQLMRFARGEIGLDIEALAARRQISAQGLIDIIGAMGIDISRKVRFGTKAMLCAAIRAAMAPPPSVPAPQAQHFNPEEDNFEPEIQYMAPAGDEDEDEEGELNTAFYEPEQPEQQEQSGQQEQPQGGAAGGWLADEVEAEAEAEAEGQVQVQPASRRTLVPNWSLVPANAQVRWAFTSGDRNLASYGYHVARGAIRFGQIISRNLAGFIQQELAAWKNLGRVPADMRPPHNAWKALEFERNGAWVRFDSIRTAV